MHETRENGIRIGIVSDLDDPERLGRVRVMYPTLEDQTSDWARLATLMGGPSRGTLFVPEPEDEVLVAFEEGDPRRPYIIGALWNRVDPPPENDNKPTENNWRMIKSRSGHIIKLNDTQGAETIEILDKDNAHKVIIDSVARTIQVITDTGSVEVKAESGSVKVQAMNVEIQATQKVAIQAPQVEITADASLKLKGLQAEVTADGSLKLEASGITTVSGSLVKIN